MDIFADMRQEILCCLKKDNSGRKDHFLSIIWIENGLFLLFIYFFRTKYFKRPFFVLRYIRIFMCKCGEKQNEADNSDSLL